MQKQFSRQWSVPKNALPNLSSGPLDRVGDQTGGRVFLFLSTDNFTRDYNNMVKAGVKFVREPATQPYGTVAVFSDPYGNLWDLLEPSPDHRLYDRVMQRT